MVFEETASHKPRSWPTWNHRSALVPKAPAQSALSNADAQTHRLSNQSTQFSVGKLQGVSVLSPTQKRGDVLPVPCLKEHPQSIMRLESVDYSFLR